MICLIYPYVLLSNFDANSSIYVFNFFYDTFCMFNSSSHHDSLLSIGLSHSSPCSLFLYDLEPRPSYISLCHLISVSVVHQCLRSTIFNNNLSESDLVTSPIHYNFTGATLFKISVTLLFSQIFSFHTLSFQDIPNNLSSITLCFI